MNLEDKEALVGEILRENSPVLIAYSGGVDSATLLALAGKFLGSEARGVIADSPSLPRKSLQNALAEATTLGIEVRVVATGEFENPDYVSNPPDRCYFCKAELFRKMDALAAAEGFRALAYGENSDDPPRERPGSRAAKEFSVLSPLRQAGIGKSEVRELARRFGLKAADAPAQPCLSSRVPHGTPVTPEILSMVESAEDAIRSLGFRILRVRHQAGPRGATARVLVAPDELPQLFQMREQIMRAALEAGYAEAELDPEGYRGTVL